MEATSSCIAFVLLSLVAVAIAQSGAEDKECIPVEDVTVLLLQKSIQITSWKGQSASQLECMDGCENSDIKSVLCSKENDHLDAVFSQHQHQLISLQFESENSIRKALSLTKPWDTNAVENNKRTIINLLGKDSVFLESGKSEYGGYAQHYFTQIWSMLQTLWTPWSIGSAQLLDWRAVITGGSQVATLEKKFFELCRDVSATSNRLLGDTARQFQNEMSTSQEEKSSSLWTCRTIDEPNGKVFDELSIICESCASQPGSLLVPGSCRLQYKLRTLKYDVFCRVASILKQWGNDTVESIKVEATKLAESVNECTEDLSKCINVETLTDAIKKVGKIEYLWKNARKLGNGLVYWKTILAVGVPITVASLIYYNVYCSNDTSTNDLVKELVGQAHLELF